MAARALVPLVTIDKLPHTIDTIVWQINISLKQDNVDNNLLHGLMLQLHHLLQANLHGKNHKNPHQLVDKMSEGLFSMKGILSGRKISCISKLAYLDIVSDIMSYVPNAKMSGMLLHDTSLVQLLSFSLKSFTVLLEGAPNREI